MSHSSNSKLKRSEEVDSSLEELPIVELEFANTDMSSEKKKEDARKPLYFKRV